MTTMFQRKPTREKRNFILALYPEEHAALSFLAEKYACTMTDVVLTALHRTFGEEIPEELAEVTAAETKSASITPEPMPVLRRKSGQHSFGITYPERKVTVKR